MELEEIIKNPKKAKEELDRLSSALENVWKLARSRSVALKNLNEYPWPPSKEQDEKDYRARLEKIKPETPIEHYRRCLYCSALMGESYEAKEE